MFITVKLLCNNLYCIKYYIIKDDDFESLNYNNIYIKNVYLYIVKFGLSDSGGSTVDVEGRALFSHYRVKVEADSKS